MYKIKDIYKDFLKYGQKLVLFFDMKCVIFAHWSKGVGAAEIKSSSLLYYDKFLYDNGIFKEI